MPAGRIIFEVIFSRILEKSVHLLADPPHSLSHCVLYGTSSKIVGKWSREGDLTPVVS
jgi:hypothetical protein